VPLTLSRIRTSSSVSPDGRWFAQTLMIGRFLPGEDEQHRTHLAVSRRDDSRHWGVVDDPLRCGLGYTVPSAFHWPVDKRYLDFTNLPRPDGCAVFVNGSDLHRVSLADGDVSTVLADGPW